MKEVKWSSCWGRFPYLSHPSLFFTLVFLTFSLSVCLSGPDKPCSVGGLAVFMAHAHPCWQWRVPFYFYLFLFFHVWTNFVISLKTLTIQEYVYVDAVPAHREITLGKLASPTIIFMDMRDTCSHNFRFTRRQQPYADGSLRLSCRFQHGRDSEHAALRGQGQKDQKQAGH